MKSQHLISISKFLIPLLVDLMFPGCGLVLEIALLLWELLAEEETERENKS
ncbi:MAG TPA: hypothetical protein VK184_05065 [Nostocaceae cyanobacterium]|nr:hypothetical protein [Nostocaceae cyanobacterium]